MINFTISAPSTIRISERIIFEETPLPKDIKQDDFGKVHIDTDCEADIKAKKHIENPYTGMDSPPMSLLAENER
jgi:hypothetical protein